MGRVPREQRFARTQEILAKMIDSEPEQQSRGKQPFFLFFSGAATRDCPGHCKSVPPLFTTAPSRAAEKQKEDEEAVWVLYKQATPKRGSKQRRRGRARASSVELVFAINFQFAIR